MKEADRVPNKINRKGPTPRYIIIKMTKVKSKERILKVENKQAKSHIHGNPHKAAN